jgi:hypothetical protein
MLGSKWEAATATVVSAETDPGATPVHRYQIEVRKKNGEVLTSSVSEQSPVVRAVGSTAHCEVHTKTGEVRLAASRADSIRGMVNMAQAIRDGATGGAAGAAGGLAAGLVGMLANQQGGTVSVTGAGGQNVPTNVDPNEIRSLTHAMIAGSPEEKQAARERLMQIRAQAMNQQGGVGPQQQQGGFGAQQQQTGFGGQQAAQGGFSGAGPGTFDDIGTPGNPASPGAGGPGALGQQGGFAAAAPNPFSSAQPSPASAQSSFGSFDMGSGQGSREERLAKLQQLLNKGILTESEYETQRQQIINGG